MKQVSSSDMLAIRWHRDGHRSKFLNPTHIVQVTQPNPTRWKISFCNPTRPKIAQFPNHRNVICNNTLTKYIHAHVKANTSRISHSVWHRLHSLSLTTSDTVTTEHLRKTRSHPPPNEPVRCTLQFFQTASTERRWSCGQQTKRPILTEPSLLTHAHTTRTLRATPARMGNILCLCFPELKWAAVGWHDKLKHSLNLDNSSLQEYEVCGCAAWCSITKVSKRLCLTFLCWWGSIHRKTVVIHAVTSTQLHYHQ